MATIPEPPGRRAAVTLQSDIQGFRPTTYSEPISFIQDEGPSLRGFQMTMKPKQVEGLDLEQRQLREMLKQGGLRRQKSQGRAKSVEFEGSTPLFPAAYREPILVLPKQPLNQRMVPIEKIEIDELQRKEERNRKDRERRQVKKVAESMGLEYKEFKKKTREKGRDTGRAQSVVPRRQEAPTLRSSSAGGKKSVTPKRSAPVVRAINEDFFL